VSRSVLVVENNPANAELAETLLALEGWDVAHASDGAEALVWLACGSPDVVLLDLLMPGMDGVTLLRELAGKDALRGLPVVVLTAAAEDAQARAREAHPGVVVLQKPAEPAAIVAALDAACVRGAGGLRPPNATGKAGAQ
jgi:CheY-like chemotaxis protein